MPLPTVSLCGNVRKPEFKYSQSGTAIHTFTLEASEKNKNGEWDNLYIKVKTFNKSAEFVNQYFYEGAVAIVTGKLVTETWTKQDGTKQYEITLKFPNVEFAPKDKATNQPQAQQQQVQQPQYQQGNNTPPNQHHMAQNAMPDIDIDDSEIPF